MPPTLTAETTKFAVSSPSRLLSLCELDDVCKTSPECSPVASKLPVTLAFALFATVKVPSSTTTPTSFCATGASLAPKIVIVIVAMSVPPLPSETV